MSKSGPDEAQTENGVRLPPVPYSLNDSSVHEFLSQNQRRLETIETLIQRRAQERVGIKKGSNAGYETSGAIREEKLKLLPGVRELFHVPKGVKPDKEVGDISLPLNRPGLREASRYSFSVSISKQVNADGLERVVYNLSFGSQSDQNRCAATIVKGTGALVRSTTPQGHYQKVDGWKDK